ncbi:MAG: polysaccharide biosynthesis tyrosine autokinase [Anaerolineae bacterium]
MTMLYLWQSLKRRAWLLLLTLLVGAAIALWYTLAQPLRFSTEATVQIASANPAADPQTAVGLADALAPTLVAYMGTQTFASQVILRSELSMTTTDLLSRVEVWHVEGTALLKVRAVSNFAQQAERIANGVAETLVAVTNEQLRSQVQTTAQDDPARQSFLQQSQEDLQYYSQLARDIQTRLDEFRSQPSSASRDEGIALLTQELVSVQDAVNQLRTVAIQMGASSATIQQPYVISVLDPAALPIVPVPRPLLGNLLLGLAIALVAGTALALLPESLDYTVATPEELEETLGITTLGAIARIGSSETEDDPIERLVARNYPRSPIAEAFRTLRTNIRFARPDRPRATILITSTQPGEGKSLVAANLAVAIAQEGRIAIVIDADLRRPTLHRFFGWPNRAGFTSLIMDESLTVEDVLQPTDVPGLSVITSGPLPPNPLDMLASKRADSLLKQVKQMCDTLVLDSPPVLSVTDALLLAVHADSALLVANARGTRRDRIVKAYETLKRSGVDVIGAVINRVRQSDLGYYYSHYYYGYYYGSPGEVPEEIPVVGRMQEPGKQTAEKA